MEDACVLVYAARHLETLAETAYTDVAREARATDVFQAGSVGDADTLPLVAGATLCFQLLYFLLCEFSH